MDQEPQTNAKDLFDNALEHSWNWFEYHANQRMSMIKFYLTVEGALAAAVSYLWTHNQYVVTALASVFGMLASFCFVRLDARVSHLVKFGEAALKVYQKEMAASSGSQQLEICKSADDLVDEKGRRKFLYPYTYGENIRLMLGAAAGAFGLSCIVSVVTQIRQVLSS